MAQETFPNAHPGLIEEPLEPFEEEVELTEEELDAMSGGMTSGHMERCPRCGSKSVVYIYNNSTNTKYWKCKLCKWTWQAS